MLTLAVTLDWIVSVYYSKVILYLTQNSIFIFTGLRYGWIATFAFDFLIFSLTFGRALRLMRSESNKRETISLARLIVRDGTSLDT